MERRYRRCRTANRSRIVSENRGGPEALERQVDRKERLPNDLRNSQEELHRTLLLDGADKDEDSCREGQRPADQPDESHPPWHEPRLEHQVAEQQPSAEAGAELGPEKKRPVMERNQRSARDRESATVCARPGKILPQRHNRHDADQARNDDRRFEGARGDIAERDRFILPLENREQHNRSGDVGDRGDDFEECSKRDSRIGTRPQDVVVVVDKRGIHETTRGWTRRT